MVLLSGISILDLQSPRVYDAAKARKVHHAAAFAGGRSRADAGGVQFAEAAIVAYCRRKL
jgi:hypothetical protein